MNDILDQIFKMIRLQSCVYFQRGFHAPWGMEISGTGFAQFHIVTRGTCYVESAGKTLDLSSGDVLLFPRGAAHTLADAPARTPAPGSDVMASLATATPMFSEGGAETGLICGHYAYRMHPSHPLITGLPDLVHLHALHELMDPVALSVLPILICETRRSEPGAVSVSERLAEVLLIQILRAHVRDRPGLNGFLSALSDARLQRALERIHADFAAPLTLTDIAHHAGMSRSGLAQHFRQSIGLAPIEYLAKWRMLNAGELLQSGGRTVADVAECSGYDSQIAFARAFKREYGMTPTQFRNTAG